MIKYIAELLIMKFIIFLPAVSNLAYHNLIFIWEIKTYLAFYL